jgi:hypothetical protein
MIHLLPALWIMAFCTSHVSMLPSTPKIRDGQKKFTPLT